VFLARFLPGLRAPAFLLAGTMHMAFWRFVLMDVLASLIFVPVLCGLGYLFADYFNLMKTWFQNVERAVGTLVVLAVLGWLIRRSWGKRENSPPPATHVADRP
jgi:membrane protein DedA with SNARE-associated domain